MVRKSISIVMILAVLVGAFMLLSGIAGLVRADSVVGQVGRALGTQGSSINIVVATIALAAGAIVLLSQFVSLGQLAGVLKLGVFIAWIVVMVLVLFVGGVAADTLAWWISLIQYGIILAVLWLVRGEK